MAKLPPMLFTLAVEQEQLFAALLATGAKLTIGVPEPVQRKPYTKQLQNGNDAAPLMLPSPTHHPMKSNRGNTSAGNIMLAHMAQHPKATHAMTDLVKACRENGTTPGAASVAMSKLLKDGRAERVGVGRYIITSEGVKAAPKVETSAPKAETAEPKRRNKPDGITNREVIMSMFQPGAPVALIDIAAQFRKDNRKPQSISPQIAKLKNDGVIAPVSAGIYQITEKGKANGTTG